MDEETRKRVDATCLRLLGWQPEEWWPETAQWDAFPPGGSIRMFCSPSRDERFVVPLAEALRERGFWIQMHTEVVGWIVEAVSGKPGGLRVRAAGDSLPLALALCAARAAGNEP